MHEMLRTDRGDKKTERERSPSVNVNDKIIARETEEIFSPTPTKKNKKMEASTSFFRRKKYFLKIYMNEHD